MKLIIRANISWPYDTTVTLVCALHVLSHVLPSQHSHKGIALPSRPHREETGREAEQGGKSRIQAMWPGCRVWDCMTLFSRVLQFKQKLLGQEENSESLNFSA